MKRLLPRSVACVALLLALISMGTPPATGQEKARFPFMLEQALSAPFPTELVAAPAHGRFAWVFNAEGKRNIWIAEPSGEGYKARQITSYSEDDGQDVGELSWTPDGNSVIYTRGGELENGKAYPNPRSFPQGVEQDVWVVPVGGGEPKKLGEGHSASASPKGDAVAYILKGQVWLVRMESGAKPEQLVQSRGESGSLRWSPDGAKLAFVSMRDDHSFIGVYDFAHKSLLYLDPGVDKDSEPVWSPMAGRSPFSGFVIRRMT